MEFAHSPYFNKHKEVRRLIEYLSKTYPDLNAKKCHRQTIFEALYPTLEFDQKKLAIIFTYAQRLVEQFLRVEESISEGILENNTLLLQQLKGIDSLLKIEKYWKEIVGGVDKKSRTVHCPAPLFSELEHLKELDEISVRLSKFDRQYLQQRQTTFDVFFVMEKLKDACELKQRNRLLKQEYQPSPLFEKIIEWLGNETISYPTYPSVEIFHTLYLLLNDGQSGLYKKAIDLIKTYGYLLDNKELQTAYNVLQNFCIGQINFGKKEYLRKLFEIYQSQLEKDLLMMNNYLPEWHYKNIVTTGLRLDEHQWVIKFINKYQEKLQPEIKYNAFSYNLATYYYHLGQFDKVLKLLVQVEYTDLRYNLDAKSLLLRTYFDMEEEVALYSLSDAFRQYLKRNKEMTEFQKSGYYNLLKITRKIFKLKIDKGFISKNKWEAVYASIKKELDKEATIFNHGWLVNKLSELKEPQQ
ncbi:MAG: hypothetical protein R2825_07535 [Saprospiraceae bacterium]